MKFTQKMKENAKRFFTIAIAIMLLSCIAMLFAACADEEKTIIGKVEISIVCTTVFDNLDKLENKKTLEFIPSNGIIQEVVEVELLSGDTVLDVLLKLTSTGEIRPDVSMPNGKTKAYVKGINQLYEKDCGALSGWQYYVNGVSASKSCGAYKLASGDKIVWAYTCDIGNDIVLS